MLKEYKTAYMGVTVTLECLHKNSFPPNIVRKRSLEEVSQIWKEGGISSSEYGKVQTWAANCGKTTMDEGCSGCTLAQRVIPKKGVYGKFASVPWIQDKKSITMKMAQEKKKKDNSSDVGEGAHPALAGTRNSLERQLEEEGDASNGEKT